MGADGLWSCGCACISGVGGAFTGVKKALMTVMRVPRQGAGDLPVSIPSVVATTTCCSKPGHQSASQAICLQYEGSQSPRRASLSPSGAREALTRWGDVPTHLQAEKQQGIFQVEQHRQRLRGGTLHGCIFLIKLECY